MWAGFLYTDVLTVPSSSLVMSTSSNSNCPPDSFSTVNCMFLSMLLRCSWKEITRCQGSAVQVSSMYLLQNRGVKRRQRSLLTVLHYQVRYYLNREKGTLPGLYTTLHVQCTQYGFFMGKFTTTFASFSTPNCIRRRQAWHKYEATSLYNTSMHRTIGKHTYGTRKAGINDPTGIAHITGVASYSKA